MEIKTLAILAGTICMIFAIMAFSPMKVRNVYDSHINCVNKCNVGFSTKPELTACIKECNQILNSQKITEGH